VNVQNDPQSCGECGNACSGATSFCAGGQCIATPCNAVCEGGTSCCGTECCSTSQLCCDPQGPIDVSPRCTEPNEEGTCPPGCAPLCICAAPDTPIATPLGERAIAELAVGDLVYSVDGGRPAIVPIVRVNRTPVANHHVLRVKLRSGAVLTMSPGHPTADGRRFADLQPGAALDGVVIADVELTPYAHDATYDILPASDTGAYFAAGVLVGSTLFTAHAECEPP
jgi:hypothetical protein